MQLEGSRAYAYVVDDVMSHPVVVIYVSQTIGFASELNSSSKKTESELLQEVEAVDLIKVRVDPQHTKQCPLVNTLQLAALCACPSNQYSTFH